MLAYRLRLSAWLPPWTIGNHPCQEPEFDHRIEEKSPNGDDGVDQQRQQDAALGVERFSQAEKSGFPKSQARTKPSSSTPAIIPMITPRLLWRMPGSTFRLRSDADSCPGLSGFCAQN